MDISSKKSIGVILAIFAVLTIILTVSYKLQNDEIVHMVVSQEGSCFLDNGTCLHKDVSSFPLIMGVVLSIIEFGLSIFYLTSHDVKKSVKKRHDLSKLDIEEKSIVEELNNNDGTLYQSDLIKSLGLSKVKITRVLDKLEGKGIIERKRRGMTNVVILK